MTYIYDVLLNFTDDDRLIEFYEWDEDDILEHIKRILLVRVSSNQLEELTNYKIRVPQEFLTRIANKTTSYKRNNNLKYAVLVSDLNRVIALEFNKQGFIISRSSLLLDEEEDIIEECFDLKEESLSYNKLKKYEKNYYLTRNEIKKRRYLLQEIKTLFKDKNIDKLTYLYDELYKKDSLSFEQKYLRLKNDLENNYSNEHNILYDIVRLTYIKK